MKSLIFFFNDTATTEIYTLSLHDALPICGEKAKKLYLEFINMCKEELDKVETGEFGAHMLVDIKNDGPVTLDRKSTRLNSSHANISYAVFCLKKKKLQEGLDQKERHMTII